MEQNRKQFLRSRLSRREDGPYKPFKDLEIAQHQIVIKDREGINRPILIEKNSGESVYRVMNANEKLMAIAFPNPLYDPGRKTRDKNAKFPYFVHLAGKRVSGFQHMSIDDLIEIVETCTNQEIISYMGEGYSKWSLKMVIKLMELNKKYKLGDWCPIKRTELSVNLTPVFQNLYDPVKVIKNAGRKMVTFGETVPDEIKEKLNLAKKVIKPKEAEV